MSRLFIFRTLFVLAISNLISCDSPDEPTVEMEFLLPESRSVEALAEFEDLFVELRINNKDPQIFAQPDNGVWSLSVEDVNLNQNNDIDVLWYVVITGIRYELASQSESFFADSTIGSTSLDLQYLSNAFDHDNDTVSNLDEIKEGTFPVVTPELVAIREPSCFLIGSPETETGRYASETQVQTCLNSYSIGKYEVSFFEFEEFTTKTNRPAPDSGGLSAELRKDKPVVNVEWTEALAYTRWLSAQTGKNYRLPTEAEWEYAARGNTTTAYNTGDTLDPSRANFMIDENVVASSPANIQQYQPNQFGLHNVHGNVFEWTCSPFSNTYSGEESQCFSDAGSRLMVIRGGSWLHSAQEARSANRGWVDTGISTVNNGASAFVGFRIAMDP